MSLLVCIHTRLCLCLCAFARGCLYSCLFLLVCVFTRVCLCSCVSCSCVSLLVCVFTRVCLCSCISLLVCFSTRVCLYSCVPLLVYFSTRVFLYSCVSLLVCAFTRVFLYSFVSLLVCLYSCVSSLVCVFTRVCLYSCVSCSCVSLLVCVFTRVCRQKERASRFLTFQVSIRPVPRTSSRVAIKNAFPGVFAVIATRTVAMEVMNMDVVSWISKRFVRSYFGHSLFPRIRRQALNSNLWNRWNHQHRNSIWPSFAPSDKLIFPYKQFDGVLSSKSTLLPFPYFQSPARAVLTRLPVAMGGVSRKVGNATGPMIVATTQMKKVAVSDKYSLLTRFPRIH